MKFNRKTRGINKKLTYLKSNEQYWLGVDVEHHSQFLQELGFTIPFVAGERLLVPAQYGTACRRNADGYEIVHRDQEMETAYRQVEWHWTQFRGRYDSEECSKIVDVPYRRYPRTVMPPFAIELKINLTDKGMPLVVAGPFILADADDEKATNTANIFIEIFGECLLLRSDMAVWKKVPTKQLNWQLLPAGKNPWQSSKSALRDVVKNADKGKRPVISARFETIGENSPEYVAIGIGGFSGYVAFGFPSLGICLLESCSVNNATYILNESEWEKISMMSKAEILNAKLHQMRLIHRENWFNQIGLLLNNKKVS